MPLAVKVRSFLRNLFSSRRVETELDAEVRSHLAMLTEGRHVPARSTTPRAP